MWGGPPLCLQGCRFYTNPPGRSGRCGGVRDTAPKGVTCAAALYCSYPRQRTHVVGERSHIAACDLRAALSSNGGKKGDGGGLREKARLLGRRT